MQTRRTLLFTATCSLVMPFGIVAAPAVDAAAMAFVTKIYDAYKGKNSRGTSIDGEAAIRRYFEPSLAAVIIKDQQAAARRKEVPVLEFDPFVDGQDWEISGIDIAVKDAPPNKAVATVSFKNFGKPSKVAFDLVKVKGEWRIANITWNRDGTAETLRGLYHH